MKANSYLVHYRPYHHIKVQRQVASSTKWRSGDNVNVSLTSLTTLTYFNAIKIKYLTTLTTQFYFTDYADYAVLLHYSQNEISDYAHYTDLLQCY